MIRRRETIPTAIPTGEVVAGAVAEGNILGTGSVPLLVPLFRAWGRSSRRPPGAKPKRFLVSRPAHSVLRAILRARNQDLSWLNGKYLGRRQHTPIVQLGHGSHL